VHLPHIVGDSHWPPVYSARQASGSFKNATT